MNLANRDKFNDFSQIIISAVIFLAITLVIIRMDFGTSGLPKGTNILDSYLSFYSVKGVGIFPWDPLTDWGQPTPGFTGPTLIFPFIEILPLSVLIRALEFIMIFLSGFLTCVAFLKSGFKLVSSLLASTYYLLMTETSQFFDGHLGLMITFALFPMFVYLLYRLVRRPSFMYSILVALLLYLIFSLGDMGGFYMVILGSIPPFLYLLVNRIRERKYERSEWALLLYAPVIFIFFSLTWLIPYLFGIHPEYTTTIITHISSFRNTDGILPQFSFSGFISDISYTLFYLRHGNYSIFPDSLYPVYLSLPILLGYYAVKERRIKLIFILLYSLFFAVIATGPIIPVVSSFNYLIYNFVPLFDYIPAVFRWDYFTVLGYTYL